MPRSSDVCERVCNLLLLLELLKAQQPGLRLEGRGSLLSLVGGRRRARPRTAAASFEQGLATFKRAPTNPLDVMIAGLDQLLDLAPIPDVEVTPSALAGQGLTLQAASRPDPVTVRGIRTRLRQVPLAIPRPVAPLAPDESDRRIVPERAVELGCAVAAPFLLKGVVSLPHPILKAAAIATLYACGIEFAEGIG